MNTHDRASKAALALHAKRTPEERKEAMRKARLSAAVNAVVNQAPDLKPEQIEKLRTLFGSAA